MPPVSVPQSRSRALSSRTLLTGAAFFVVAALAFTVVFVGIIRSDADIEMAELHAREDARVSITAGGLEARVDAAASDARVAAASRAVSNLAETRTEESFTSASSVFRSFVSNKPNILQMRFIDEGGMERLAVRRTADGAERVSDASLKDWSGHSAFEASRGTAPGESYVSSLDFELDASGEVIEPRQPVARVLSPLADADGSPAGDVVVDLDGTRLIERFEELMGSQARGYLFDTDGTIIASPDDASGFGSAPTFDQLFPAVWDAVDAADTGTVETSAGFVTFATAHLDHTGVRLADEHHSSEGHEHPNALRVVSLVPSEALPSAALSRDGVTLTIYCGGLLLLAALALLLAQMRGARLQLRRSERRAATRLAAIRDTLGEGLLVMDPHGRVVDANPESCRMLGWSREQMLGRDAHEFLHSHPEHVVPAEECELRAVATTGTTYRSEDEVFQRRDGSKLPVSATVSPLVVDGIVEGTVAVFRDTTEIRRYQEEIQRLAFRDVLTGLPNRRVFSERLEHAIETAERRPHRLAVMFLDLDGFKQVNDEHGHDVGDVFLKQISARLRDRVRTGDTLARQGGDEFVVLLPQVEDEAQAETIAARIIDGLREPFDVDGRSLRASVSIGIALLRDRETADEIVARADAAMYTAKVSGDNRYCLSGR